MPLPNYGVLKAHPIAAERGAGERPHFQILVEADDTRWRLAINVRAVRRPVDLLFCVERDFRHPVVDFVATLAPGFHRRPLRAGGGIDYLRDGLFRWRQMRPVPADRPGPHNDLQDALEHALAECAVPPLGMICAFGDRWGPKPGLSDPIFDFTPDDGLHNIHMNQGNPHPWANEDGIRQDGGLFLSNGDGRWTAIFLAFQTQSRHTDRRGRTTRQHRS